MKILVICQHYYPETFRITDICEELVKRGNDVFVVTGYPEYPEGVIYDGYRDKKHADEVVNGVKIHRCFTIGRKGGVFKRVLNYYSYALSSVGYVKKLKEKFDVVLVNQLSPVMMANAGVTYSKKNKVPLVTYVLDLWPASLSAGNISDKSIIYKHYHKVSKKIYRAADKLLVSSQTFVDYLEEQFGINREKIIYFPQYSEDCFNARECEKRMGDTIDLMFAGNVGKVQSIDTIIEAAKKCSDIKNLHWHIVGDGVALQDCKIKAEQEKVPVLFHGRQPLEKMPEYYAMADAMLVTMVKDSFLSLTLPGKVQTYMAAGKPIIGAIDGEASSVIQKAECGFCGESEDATALAENVRKFCGMTRECMEKLGQNARAFYERNFEKKKILDKLEAVLTYEIVDD